MGRLRFGVAFAVTGKELDSCLRRNDDKRRLPRRGEETEEANWGQQDAKVNYPVQGTPGSLTSL